MTALTRGFALSVLLLAFSAPVGASDFKPAECKPTSTTAKCLLQAIATLQGQVAVLQGQVTTLQQNNALLLGPFVSVDHDSEKGLAGPHITIQGANVHIQSGSGKTVDSTGLGNLIIGYDEDSLGPTSIDPNRNGSHNLIVGEDHQFTSSGGAVFGFSNSISTTGSTVTGGACNVAGSMAFPNALGTPCNEAPDSSFDSSVSGGRFNTASGITASISGGEANASTGTDASVSGGEVNTASGSQSSVTGGNGNMATALDSSVSGGEGNEAAGQASSILGGSSVAVGTRDGHLP